MNNCLSQEFPVEKSGDSFFCMDQYYKLIGTCRIPKKSKDQINIMHIQNFCLTKNNHVTVLHNNKVALKKFTIITIFKDFLFFRFFPSE